MEYSTDHRTFSSNLAYLMSIYNSLDVNEGSAMTPNEVYSLYSEAARERWTWSTCQSDLSQLYLAGVLARKKALDKTTKHAAYAYWLKARVKPDEAVQRVLDMRKRKDAERALRNANGKDAHEKEAVPGSRMSTRLLITLPVSIALDGRDLKLTEEDILRLHATLQPYVEFVRGRNG